MLSPTRELAAKWMTPSMGSFSKSMSQKDVYKRQRWERVRCRPATPTSYRRVTWLPSTSAVRAASSATGMSLVPPVATTMVPLPVGAGISPTMPMRPISW